LTILCAVRASAQEEVRVSPGTSFSGGASFGGPIGASVMAEILYGPGADVRDEGEGVRGRVGGLFQAHAGSGGGKLSLGVGGRARIHTDDFKGPVTVGLKVSAARTWREPVGTAERLTYIGPELDFSVMRVAVSVGTLWRIDGAAGKRVLFSWGVGIRP
jgi:hypothetical protein